MRIPSGNCVEDGDFDRRFGSDVGRVLVEAEPVADAKDDILVEGQFWLAGYFNEIRPGRQDVDCSEIV